MRPTPASFVLLLLATSAAIACSTTADEDLESSTSSVTSQRRPSRLFSPGMDGEVAVASDACAGGDDPTYASHLACAPDGKSLHFCSGGKAYTRVSCAEGCFPGTGLFGAYCRTGPGTRQKIVVSQKLQRLRAYENGSCVNEFPISSGDRKAWYSEAFGTREQLYGDNVNFAEPDGRLKNADGTFSGTPWHITTRLHDWYMGDPRTSETPWTLSIHPTRTSKPSAIAFHSATWTRGGPRAPQVLYPEASSSDAAASDPRNNCGHCGKAAEGVPQSDGSVRYYGSSHGCINERVQDARWLALWVNYASGALNDGAPLIYVIDEDFEDAETPCAYTSSPATVKIAATDANQCYLANGAAVDYTAALGNPPSAREIPGAATPHAGLRGEGCYGCSPDGRWKSATGCPIVASETDANQCYLVGNEAVDLNAAKGNPPTGREQVGTRTPHRGLRGEGCYACGADGRWGASISCE